MATPTLKRGAIPSPRSALAAAKPHVALVGAPATFLNRPQKISMWGNDVHGDCVTAEEAFAKACYSPEILISDDQVIAWATKHGVLEGAYLTDVMNWMKTDGFKDPASTYDDGPCLSVNWANESVLKSAIASGPVKLGVAADQIETAWHSTGGRTGWFATGFHADSNEDHCVALCGYGSVAWLAQQLGVSVPSGVDGSGAGYAMFTWNSIGIIDAASMKAVTSEAWLRQPTTVVVPSADFGLLFYEASSGTGELYTVSGQGELTLLSSNQGWRTDWTQIVPGNFGGNTYADLLFYEGGSGTGEFYTVSGQAGITLLSSHQGWRSDWTQIVPGSFGGDGYTDLLFYEASSGTGEFYTCDGRGGITLLSSNQGWRTDWTQILPGNFGGNGCTDLLFYEAATGTGEFYTCDGQGGMTLLASVQGWRTDWTRIVPGNFGGDGYTDLLFYEASSGTGEFYTCDGQGGMTLLSSHQGWRTDWTQIVAGDFGGSGYTDLLFYEAATGTGEFYTCDGQGGITLLSSHQGWRTDWTQIVAG